MANPRLRYKVDPVRAKLSNAKELPVYEHKAPAPRGRKYMPHQKVALEYILSSPEKNVLVADDMGLGKTVEAAMLINYMSSDFMYIGDPFLVICPAYLKLNWKAELDKWLVRDLDIQVVMPNTKEITGKVVIINYEVLVKFRKELHSKHYEALIIDEGHYLQNPKAQRTIMVYGGTYKYETWESIKKERIKPLSSSATLVLTGTPMMNNPINLWPHLKRLDGKNWNNFYEFASKYCGAKKTKRGWDFTGKSRLAELGLRLRSTIMLRRKYAEVMEGMPGKSQQWIELASGKELLPTSEDYEKPAEQFLACLAKLRRQTGEKKVEAAVKYIKDILTQESKIVVFAYHRSVAEKLQNKLAGSVRVDGGTTIEAREANIKTFREDKKCKCIIGTIGTLGTGSNLQVASVSVFVELDWLSELLEQAENRLYRIGQKKAVRCVYLTLQNSVDMLMRKAIERKSKTIKRILTRDNLKKLQGGL